MNFTVQERVILLQILPAESDYLTFKILNELKSELAFTEEEIADYEIKNQGHIITWNKDKSVDKEIEIKDKAIEIIKTALSKLSEEKRINEHNINLYERFVVKPQSNEKPS